MEEENEKINDEMVTSLYGLFVKNMDQIQTLDNNSDEIDVSDNFNKLYKATKEDSKEFFTLVKKATKDELSICLEVAKSVKVVQCILEEYKVTDGIIECYKNAVLYDYINIVDYIEEKHTRHILDLIESESDDSEPYSDREEEEDS